MSFPFARLISVNRSIFRQNSFAPGAPPQIRATVARPAPVQIRHVVPENGAQPQVVSKGNTLILWTIYFFCAHQGDH